MIDEAVNHIVSRLNQHLRRSPDLVEDAVVVSNILEQDGSVVSNVENKLVAFLVNIQKDTMPHRQVNGTATGADRSVVTHRPVYLNLYLMFAAHFSGNNYQDALRSISNTINFFQSVPVFNHQNSPDLDERIEKLVLDIENLSMHELSTLWGVLSGKYMPSVLYRVRMIAFDSGDVVEQVSTSRVPQSSASGN